jgi:hypothetical protein
MAAAPPERLPSGEDIAEILSRPAMDCGRARAVVDNKIDFSRSVRISSIAVGFRGATAVAA